MNESTCAYCERPIAHTFCVAGPGLKLPALVCQKCRMKRARERRVAIGRPLWIPGPKALSR